MTVLYAITCGVGILFMITFMFIGIWLFIATLKAFQQLRYRNYILEKIYSKMDNLNNKNIYSEENLEDEFNVLDFDDEDTTHSNLKNIK